MTKQCIICQKNFETKSKNHCEKTCSKECRLQHRKETKKINIQNHLSTFNCKYCRKEVTRYRERGGFCSRSCASKKYIEDGTYDTWRYRIQEKKGSILKCTICFDEFYAEPKESLTRKYCRKSECHKKYFSNWMKENSPVRGIKEKPETREKIKKTLMEKYGVQNAYELAKHTSLSKPQKEIINYLQENTNYTILADFPLYKDKKCFKVDILIKELNKIIEFNGTYWHTDPRFYKEDYLNKKKNKLAKEIWEEDNLRIKTLKEMNYNVDIIWEYDYISNKENILKGLLNETKD